MFVVPSLWMPGRDRTLDPGLLACTLALWHSGTLALWHSGTLALWHSGTLVLLCYSSGTLALLYSGSLALALRHSGTIGGAFVLLVELVSYWWSFCPLDGICVLWVVCFFCPLACGEVSLPCLTSQVSAPGAAAS